MHDYLFLIISSFAQLFLISCVVWMGSLLVLMFREMFKPGELILRDYFRKVFKSLILCLELVAYCAVVIYLIMMLTTGKYVDYGMSLLAAIVLSSIYLSIRKRRGGFPQKLRRKASEEE